MKAAMILSLAVAAGAVCGAGALHLVSPSLPDAAVLPPPKADTVRIVTKVVTNVVTRVVTNQAAVINDERVELLQQEARVLRQQLAARVAELDQIAAEKEAAEKEREERRQSWRDREARQQEEDPEAYEARQKQRETFRQQMTQSVTDKTQFLKQLDVSRMTDAELGSHNELLQRIEETWAVIDAMQQGGTFPDREARGKLRENFVALNDLYATERDYVLREVGAGLGYDEKESADFSAYMKEIFELTSPRPPQGMRGMGIGRPPSDRSREPRTP